MHRYYQAMASALRAAKNALRKEIKKRVAALNDAEKLRQSEIVVQKVSRESRHLRYRLGVWQNRAWRQSIVETESESVPVVYGLSQGQCDLGSVTESVTKKKTNKTLTNKDGILMFHYFF